MNPMQLSQLIAANRHAAPVLRVGTYRHPSAGWTMDVTGDTLDGLAATFAAMRDNGVTVPITLDYSMSAEAVQGVATDVHRDGDALVMGAKLTDDAHALATDPAVTLGVEIERGYVDGMGRAYGDAIVAVSFVTAGTGRMAASMAGRTADAMVDDALNRFNPAK